MIAKMKKISLVMHQSDRAQVLETLQQNGSCHIADHEPVDPQKLEAFVDKLHKLEHCEKVLSKTAADFQINLPRMNFPGSTEDFLKLFDIKTGEIRALDRQLEEDRRDEKKLEPWGDFLPPLLGEIEKSGIRYALCSSAATDFRKFKPTKIAIEVIKEEKEGIWFAAFWHRREKPDATDQAILGHTEDVPMRRIDDVRASIGAAEEKLHALHVDLLDLSRHLEWLSLECDGLRDQIAHISTRDTMEGAAGDTVYVLEGYVPAEGMDDLNESLKDSGAVLVSEDPHHHDKKVPTLLKQNPFARLFEPILRMFSLPNYWELDPTPFFAPFYTIFFGLCLADFGYGALLFIVAGMAFIAIKKKETRRLITLGIVLAISVMLAGVLLDDYFGARLATDAIEGTAAGVPDVVKDAAIFRPYTEHEVQSLSVMKFQEPMLLPMLLGVIQILLGWALRIRNSTRHCGWQGFGVPTGNMLVLVGLLLWSIPMAMGPAFHIGPMQIGHALSFVPPNLGLILLAVGLGLILLFNGAETNRKVFIRPLAGLWNLYELAVGILGDILSYLRLFALGLAGGLLAEAVNGMGVKMVGDSAGLGSYLAMTAVLIFGHALNLGIGLLSAFVHSLRLQFVEFYKAVEFKGGGIEYSPLRSLKRTHLNQRLKVKV